MNSHNKSTCQASVPTVVADGVAPPIPAAVWVSGVGSNRLRVDYDDVVQFSDLVVARVSSEHVSKMPSKCPKYYRLTLGQPRMRQ